LKIEDYLNSLPQEIINGNDIQLPERSFKQIFDFVEIGNEDIFYHLGCHDSKGLEIAVNEYNVRKAIGVDIDKEKIDNAKKISKYEKRIELKCEDITESDLSEATVILFWFTEETIIEKMMKKFEVLKPQTKIITIWGPLPDCLPQKVDFPFILNQVPFKKTNSLQEQILSIFGVKCIDFVTAWEYAERYTKAIEITKSGNDRFLTILQSVTIWINAKNLGVSCTEEIPESIKTYIGILKTFFNIEVEHLLK